jgi:hypothetical protein
VSTPSGKIKPIHTWLRKINVAYIPGLDAACSQSVVEGILRHFRLFSHRVQDVPNDETDVILTTARFGQPLGWREAPLFYARKKFGLKRTPTVYTLVNLTRAQFQEMLTRLETLLRKTPPDPADYDFPGLSLQAYRILIEQGKRGGAILTLERLVQAQTKSIHVLLSVGTGDSPEEVYHFDLVGAYPKSAAPDLESLYADIVLRMVTTLSTHEVTRHAVVGAPIPYATWFRLETPKAMSVAGRMLGERDFFTEMIRISDLAPVPAITDAIASQYSEGCFATWDPTIDALVATITGSARPVDKGNITEDDLAVIVGVRQDGLGALIRRVEGKRNDPPSSESVEMMDMDSVLPRVELEWNRSANVPVIRSKLHGHRAVAAFDSQKVEFAPLDPPYYYYLVSCATAAQAQGIKAAFARAETLRNPSDPRQVVFTVLPGHGSVIVEKWIADKAPFQVLWELMDSGALQITSRLPQGPLSYTLGADGRMVLTEANSTTPSRASASPPPRD